MSEIRVDTISEKTSANGVAVDGLTIKDGGLTVASGSKLIFTAGGSISEIMVDHWRVTANFTTSSGEQFVTANWERADGEENGQVNGTMTQASGVFTFPHTGKYEIIWNANGATSSQPQNKYWSTIIRTTVNNSTFNLAAYSYGNLEGDGYFTGAIASILFDVTDTTTHKIKFGIESEAASLMLGDSNVNISHVVFRRIGDT